MTYEEARVYLAQTYGWTFEQIDNMTFEQISSAAREGKPNRGIKAGSLEEALKIQRDMRANWRHYYGV